LAGSGTFPQHRRAQRAEPADLTWTEAAAALSTATGVPVKAQRITDNEQRAAGMGEVAVEGIVGMSIGKREGFTPEQPRSVLTTTPGSLVRQQPFGS
jgi:hypothetical protein